jgi:hypothetical protein
LRRTLTATGLSGISIGEESAFAASTGDACVHGTFTPHGSDLSIGPPAADSACHL